MMRVLLMLLAAFALSGCYRNNMPVSEQFGPLVDVPTARMFVDANGILYPRRDVVSLATKTLRRRHTIAAMALPDATMTAIAAEETGQLDALAEQMRGKRRVFILVHGYNTSELQSVVPYDIITQRLGAGRGDIVIRFHWDGLVRTGPGGELTSWFKAVHYSQTAGVRGLRRILDLAHGQDVFLLSHSRGASVILSALSDPPFDPKFMAKAAAAIGPRPDAPPLAENGNRIHAIMLAPAIGKPDFWPVACSGAKTCDSYRQFSPQVTSLRYTINPNDLVLKKGIRGLASRLHATDLGYDPTVGDGLRSTYPCLIATTITLEKHGHRFMDYVHDKELKTMLTASAGDTRPCTR